MMKFNFSEALPTILQKREMVVIPRKDFEIWLKGNLAYCITTHPDFDALNKKKNFYSRFI